MASYTMELREVLATLLVFDGVDVSKLTTKDLIEQGRGKLFNFPYEMFDDNYRSVWETNFIRNFFFREIGFETEDLFQFQLESWLRINMPYFNKMFESELLEFDPLINSEMTTNTSKNKDTDTTINTTINSDSTKTNKQQIDGTEHRDVDGTEHRDVDGTESQTVNRTQNDTNFNRHLESDTPDSRLAITTADGSGVIEYASKIEEDSEKNNSTVTNDVDTTTANTVESTTSNTLDSTSSNTIDGTNTDSTDVTNNTTNNITDVETYVSNRTGKVGDVTYSKMLMEYRQSLIRVENKMFDEMQQLFMLVY